MSNSWCSCVALSVSKGDLRQRADPDARFTSASRLDPQVDSRLFTVTGLGQFRGALSRRYSALEVMSTKTWHP